VKQLFRFLACSVVVGGMFACPVEADVFELHRGGAVHGTLTNRDQSPRKTFVVKTASGGQVTIEAEQVKKIRKQSPAEVAYDRIRAQFADTVEDQWKLAEWCRENRLLKQRRSHLERLIELDPNHAQARRGLGYSQVRGRWVTREAMMQENGYLRYKGAWLLPEEIEIKERERKEQLARLSWAGKLKRWNRWLGSDKAAQAIANINAITDPYAADALARQLTDHKQTPPRHIRLLYVEALGRLEGDSGMAALVNTSLYDADDEVRLTSLDQVVDHNYKPAVAKYVRALRDKQNGIVNRAAVCLGQMKDPAAIGPLIGALVTEHTLKIQQGQTGQTSATFGTGPGSSRGGGFSFGGGGPKTIKRQFQNRDVLASLVSLAGTSFNYDERAWKKWYASQRTPSSLDARRDGASP
jgi:hypothetical protein